MTSLPELQEVGGCPSMSSLALCSEAGPSHMQPWAYSGIMAKAPNQHCLLGEIPCFRSCPIFYSAASPCRDTGTTMPRAAVLGAGPVIP